MKDLYTISSNDAEKGKIYYREWASHDGGVCSGLIRVIQGIGAGRHNSVILIKQKSFNINSSAMSIPMPLREATPEEIQWFEMCERVGIYVEPFSEYFSHNIFN